MPDEAARRAGRVARERGRCGRRGPSAGSRFDPAADLVFDYGPPLPGHANGLCFSAFDAAGHLHLQETYYSIGGGFVVTAAELARPPASRLAMPACRVPYPFGSAAEMLAMGAASRPAASPRMKRANETVGRGGRGEPRCRPRPALGGDGRLHRPRARRRGHPAGRPARPAPGARDPSRRCSPSAATT